MMRLVIVIVIVGDVNQCLHFKHVHHREEFGEQEEKGKEDSECTEEKTNLNPRRGVHRPRGWKVITVEGGGDDYETLKPHPDVDEDGQHKCGNHVGPDFFEPKKLRADYVAREHCPISTNMDQMHG